MSRTRPSGGHTHVNAWDLVDQIRRHIRALSLVKRKGPGPTVFFGEEGTIDETDTSLVDADLDAAIKELQALRDIPYTKPPDSEKS